MGAGPARLNHGNIRPGYKARSPEIDDEIARRILIGQSVTFIVRDLVTTSRNVYEVMKERGLVSSGKVAKETGSERKQKEREERMVKQAIRQAAKEARAALMQEKKEQVTALAKEAARLKEERKAIYDDLRRQRRAISRRQYKQRKKEASIAGNLSLTDLRVDDADSLRCSAQG